MGLLERKPKLLFFNFRFTFIKIEQPINRATYIYNVRIVIFLNSLFRVVTFEIDAYIEIAIEIV